MLKLRKALSVLSITLLFAPSVLGKTGGDVSYKITAEQVIAKLEAFYKNLDEFRDDFRFITGYTEKSRSDYKSELGQLAKEVLESDQTSKEDKETIEGLMADIDEQIRTYDMGY